MVYWCQNSNLVLSLFKNILKYWYAGDKIIDISNKLGCYFGSNRPFVVFDFFILKRLFKRNKNKETNNKYKYDSIFLFFKKEHF